MIVPQCICENGVLQKLFNKAGRDIYECNFCGLLTVYPVPDNEGLKDYYEKSYLNGRYFNRTLQYAVELREKTFFYWFNLIKNFVPPGGRLLDIGCGDGTAMRVAEKFGFYVFGNDISESASDVAKKYWGERIYTGKTIGEFNLEKKFFDCITMFDFIEHTDKPLKYLTTANALLKDDGHLIISTHDAGSVFRKIMGKNWSYLNPEEHLNCFTKKALKILLEKSKFRVKWMDNVLKYINFEFLRNEFYYTSKFLHSTFNLLKGITPVRFWNRAFPFYFGEILCVAEKVIN